jgi:3-isopropylmalate/(R)-2-methylmalate dehydratase large subunit
MGMTVTEKIIAGKAKQASVAPGEIHDVPVDRLFVHDNNGPIALQQFARLDIPTVWNSQRIHFVLDHHSPSTTFRAARHHGNLREFAKQQGIHVIEVGRGVSHPVMAEEGLARPGGLILGTDSHTVGLGAFGCLATGIGSTEAAAVMATGRIWLKVPPTIKVVLNGRLPAGTTARDAALYLLGHFGPSFLNYTAIEFYGSLVEALTVEERMAITIMCLEMGVKNALMPADTKVAQYLQGAGPEDRTIQADPEAAYISTVKFDLSALDPMVATPGMPTNGVSVDKVIGVPIQQATLGSCAGAYYHDLEQAAQILAGQKVHPAVRFIVVPNTARVVARAARSGVLATLVEAGAVISSPACGTCAGYEVGCLAPGEVCISTTTRNMEGRMGPGGHIYLAAAPTVAASALAGEIADPRGFCGGMARV